MLNISRMQINMHFACKELKEGGALWLATPTVERRMCSHSATQEGECETRECAKKLKTRAERLSTTSCSKMASLSPTDNQDNVSALFSEEQCQWLKRLVD